jgi:hypothetical protein
VIPAGVGGLRLVIRDQTQYMSDVCKELVCRTEIWELWRDETEQLIFVAPRQEPPCLVCVDQGFQFGEVFRNFSQEQPGRYPLIQGLEIVLFVNWLAGMGDCILHASGAVIEGEGYCFAGPSGVGKSTLATQLARKPSTTILGEDQIILRWIKDGFWIYGTPWHENSDLCSPIGAPLKKIFFLSRGSQQLVEVLPPLEGVTRLLQTAFIPYYRPLEVVKILDRLDLLARRIPFFHLSYTLGADIFGMIQT